MSDRPHWYDTGDDIWRADWQGLTLLASHYMWSLQRGSDRITGGNYMQPSWQRPASTAVRLKENQDRCFNAAWRHRET